MNSWYPSADYFSKKGYSGIIVTLPMEINSLDEAVDYLEMKKMENNLIPPIMITNSLSTYIAQKYLESFSLQGLVMFDPISPTNITDNVIEIEMINNKQVSPYYPNKLIKYILNNPGQSKLNLEKGMVVNIEYKLEVNECSIQCKC